MPQKSQFQNLVLQQVLQDHTQQPTTIQPALTLPIKPEVLAPLPLARPLLPARSDPETLVQTIDEPDLFTLNLPTEMETPALSGELLPPTAPSQPSSRKKRLLRGVVLLLSVLLMLAIGLTWRAATPTAASPTMTQQTYNHFAGVSSPQAIGSLPPATTATGTGGLTIQVYIVGAVRHPGIYTLPANARVYQLLEAAGGTLPDADLVSINLAAKLTDGQEIYVLSIGETPPTYSGYPAGTGADGTPLPSGSLVNINTATESEMRQALHISATTAQKIIDYRAQHGPYTSVDQLLQVVSKTIYDRIKNLVMV